ncbi:unnamed protein product [Arctia plantaginis]|uniref:Uncharacterized protein n=1 Tax=Arctia plantaginis TaxID=874455 RepID=A0A8S0YWX0_ARCPL|nr:unnamed protein product [Arctia plantaginis]CAB3229874.1 unnamed protein product [Arctia plantaginis]
MGKRVYPGLYMRARTKPLFSACTHITLASIAEAPNHWDFYSKMMSNYVSTFYATISGNYVVIVTLLFVMVLTFLLPDISNKLQASHELKNMKELMGKMTSEVKQAEVACLAVADEICCIHCAMKKSNTETVSISKSKCETCQSAPAIACRLPSPSPPEPKKKLVSFEESSSPLKTLQTRKSPLCRTSTPTRLMPKNL